MSKKSIVIEKEKIVNSVRKMVQVKAEMLFCMMRMTNSIEAFLMIKTKAVQRVDRLASLTIPPIDPQWLENVKLREEEDYENLCEQMDSVGMDFKDLANLLKIKINNKRKLTKINEDNKNSDKDYNSSLPATQRSNLNKERKRKDNKGVISIKGG
eukprot:CAMPEP_0116892450 /NCGR_PEP_ID=MMETSP0467-20121206/2665_1 /TAXON_ID=283647 /ORGANISM="Mesodinium pulex, Strain SPMC105" /LENGTH=154 /DNA_ID=CAMNT_0004561575 /DNA_START=1130 /DNA_END=1594 /DNA_ORIENTATION=-